MKISEILTEAKLRLKNSGVENVGLDSLILLSHALSFSKEKIIFNPDLELSLNQQQSFFDLIERRTKREPISHLIEKREFFGRDFFVNSNVLDPRPDSETLIELVLKNFPQKESSLKILEIGSGSGCLIITLLSHFSNSNAVALDISKKALEIAQKNAINHEIINRLQLIESDLFANLENAEKFDLIISNPPYIPSSEIENLQDEVKKFEPRLALDGGFDGLDFYRQIAAKAKNFLNEKGKVILEIGQNQEKEVAEIFIKEGFLFNESKADLAGIERALCFSVNG